MEQVIYKLFVKTYEIIITVCNLQLRVFIILSKWFQWLKGYVDDWNAIQNNLNDWDYFTSSLLYVIRFMRRHKKLSKHFSDAQWINKIICAGVPTTQ